MADKQTDNPLSAAQQQQKDKESYATWAKRNYDQQYERWMPWVEDQYLRWFTKDNKASYATKDQLSKTKVTGNSQVDNLQDGVNNLVSSQVAPGGIAEPFGKMAGSEGINRAERGGKDDKGEMAPGPAGQVADGAKTVGSGAVEGVKNAGGFVGGLVGQRKE